MVVDNIGTPEKPEFRFNFLIFDAIMYEGKVCSQSQLCHIGLGLLSLECSLQSLRDRPYENRQAYIEHIIKARDDFRHFRQVRSIQDD